VRSRRFGPRPKRAIGAKSLFRIVLDTNILLRLLLARPGTIAAKLRSRLENAQSEIVLSPATIRELTDTLMSPSVRARHGRSSTAIDAFVQSLTEFSVLTPGALAVDVPELLSRDPDDIAILAAALESKAAFLVTQDNDLLVLGDRTGVRIVELPEFYRILHSLYGE
jgi:putative PIN family toxin of toxin-antitoxin system